MLDANTDTSRRVTASLAKSTIRHAEGRPRFSEDDLPVALLLVAFTAFACVLPAQSDSFYHLRSGEQMWQSGALIRTESFSWTHPGHPIANHWWLSQLIFYGLYEAGGPVLLGVAAGCVALAALLMSWRLVRGSSETQLVALITLALTLPEWSLRPQVFSLLFTAVALHLVISRRYVLLLMVLVLWANMHAVVVLGIGIAAVPLLYATLWEREKIPRGLVLAMGAAAAPLITPYGWQYWTSMISTVQNSRAIGLQEYRSAFNVDWGTLLFWGLCLAFLLALVWKRRRVAGLDEASRVLILAAAVLFPPAVTSVRNIPFFVMAAVPALSRILATTERPRRHRPASVTAWAMLSAAFVMAIAFVTMKWKDGGRLLGWQPLAAEAITAIDACPEPIYNSFNDGGTLMWFVRHHRVFIDGRVEAYPLDFLLRARRADLQGDYASLFSEYGIRCAVVPTDLPIYAALRGDTRMHRVYERDGWSVFAR
jgi:hypothetical protein